jgi:hypothetical protein
MPLFVLLSTLTRARTSTLRERVTLEGTVVYEWITGIDHALGFNLEEKVYAHATSISVRGS